jgi:hypothetical protein
MQLNFRPQSYWKEKSLPIQKRKAFFIELYYQSFITFTRTFLFLSV